jgi:hypothetical protein
MEAFSLPWALIVIAINGRAKMVVNFLTARINLNKININQSFLRHVMPFFSLFIEEIKSILLDSKRVLPTETN